MRAASSSVGELGKRGIQRIKVGVQPGPKCRRVLHQGRDTAVLQVRLVGVVKEMAEPQKFSELPRALFGNQGRANPGYLSGCAVEDVAMG